MIGRAVSVLALLVVAGCGGGTGSDHALPDASDVASDVAFDAGADQDAAPDLDALSGPTPTLTVEVDTADVFGEISPALFGANLPWVGLAGRTVDYGDVLRDRSFRTGLNPATPWVVVPGSGSVSFSSEPGDTEPFGGHPEDGFVTLAQDEVGYTCVDQLLMTRVLAGVSYELSVSTYGETVGPTLSAFIADQGFLPVETLDNMITATDGEWTRHVLELRPESDEDVALLRLCLVSAGALRLDEVRLRRAGAEPRVKQVLIDRIGELGVTGLRWPGGTEVDTFDWHRAVGSVASRGELVTSLGRLETPAFGLHEFLDLCETLGLEPLLQVNILDTPDSAADLVEYVRGSRETAQGALRAANGRSEPWPVTRFELGNEPTANYTVAESGDTGAAYAAFARPVAAAMRSRATELGVTLELGGVVEIGFQSAEYLSAVPILRDWNSQAFDPASGLGDVVDFTHGHYYAYFGYDPEPSKTFAHVMAGGQTLRHNDAIARAASGAKPLWLTEYHVAIDDDGLQPAALWDLQAGLGVAGLLMGAIDDDVAGAHLFNLSEQGSFGVLRGEDELVWRPAAYAFALLSPLAGSGRLATRVTGDSALDTITIDPSNPGTNALGTSYPAVGVLAGRDPVSGVVSVVLLNRRFAGAEVVALDLGDMVISAARSRLLWHPSLSAGNEAQSDEVSASLENLEPPYVVELPPHSMRRVEFVP